MSFLQTPPIILFGMHRSGTTLLARIISKLGVFLGNDLKGHHESYCFRNINNELLALRKAHWAKPEPFLVAVKTEEFSTQCHSFIKDSLNTRIKNYGAPADSGLWGWKDPRNTLTLPVWLRYFPNAKLLYIYRNGIDVALSVYRREIRFLLKKREAKRLFPPSIGASYRLWETHVKTGDQLAKHHEKCLTLRYEDLLLDSASNIKGIAEFLGIEVDDQRVKNLARDIIRNPTKRSGWDNFRIRLISGLGLINPDCLEEHGYGIYT